MQNQSYIKLAWWTMGAIYLVILAGSLVRMTGSGMGCPDWPKCFGYYIPPTDIEQVLWKPGKEYFDGQMIVHNDVLYSSNSDMTSATTFSPANWTEYTKHSYAKFNAQHTWIEYVNRLAGAVSGFFVLGLFIMTFLGWRKGRFKGIDVFYGFVLLFLLGFQAWLGKTVVDSNLAPLKITFHMFGALAIVALLVYMIRRARTEHGTILPKNIKAIGWLAFVLILVQIYLGTSVRQEVDAVVSQYDHQQRDLWMGIVDQTGIFKIHRSFAWLILAVVGGFLWKSKTAGAWSTAHNWIAGTLIGEVLVGVVLTKFDIPALGQPAHLMLACLLFSFLLWVLLGSKVKKSLVLSYLSIPSGSSNKRYTLHPISISFMDMKELISDQRRKLEIIAVSATGLGKLLFMDYLQWIVPFLTVAILGWSYYIYKRSQENEGILTYWGFRTDNISSVTKFVLPFGILGVLSFVAIGYWQGTLNPTWHVIPIFLLYPIWGIIQQFLLMSLFAGNLKDHSLNDKSNLTIIILTSLLFAAVHYPYYWLIGGTFILALIYTFVFLKERNLYVLGCFHGWLGAIFYYTVMTRDPWVEMLHSLGIG